MNYVDTKSTWSTPWGPPCSPPWCPPCSPSPNLLSLTWVIPTHPKSIWLKPSRKFLVEGGWVLKTKNRVLLTWPGPEFNNKCSSKETLLNLRLVWFILIQEIGCGCDRNGALHHQRWEHEYLIQNRIDLHDTLNKCFITLLFNMLSPGLILTFNPS